MEEMNELIMDGPCVDAYVLDAALSILNDILGEAWTHKDEYHNRMNALCAVEDDLRHVIKKTVRLAYLGEKDGGWKK